MTIGDASDKASSEGSGGSSVDSGEKV